MQNLGGSSKWLPDYIIGNDMSLTDSGITVLDGEGKRVDTFSIKTKASPIDHHRIDHIVQVYFENINKYLEKGKIAFVFEDILFSGKKSAKAGARFQLLGVIQWNLRQMLGVKTIAIGPNVWVSNVLYPAKVPMVSKDRKEAINAACRNKYGFYTENRNISDSYGIARTGYQYFVLKKRITVRAISGG